MARKISEFTEAILAIVDEVAIAKEKANAADPIPPMVERMTMSQGKKEEFLLGIVLEEHLVG